MPNTPAVFTIGHSNHSEQHFIDLLTKHGIEVLADVRSQPFSKYTPHFNREYLQGTLRDRRMKYLFMGDQLGGRPEGHEFYDEEGYVLYYRLVGVADICFYEADHRSLRRDRVAQAQAWLANSAYVLLSLGLSRPYRRSENDQARHWLQVNNIHWG